MEEINIAFSISDKNGDYSRHLGVVLLSIFKNTKSKIHIYVLHDDTLSYENKELIAYIINTFSQNITFKKVELERIVEKNLILERVSRATLFRLYLNDILDVDKCIYLDLDVIINLDINLLWNEFKNKDLLIGAVLDGKDYRDNMNKHSFYRKLKYKKEIYFNAGVILFNLRKLNEMRMCLYKCIDFLKKYPKAPATDQDALNYCYRDKVILLDSKYNVIVNQFFKYNKMEEEPLSKKFIWHFAGVNKPWDSIIYPIDKLYWEYFLETPWCYEKKSLIKYISNLNKNIFLETVLLNGKIGSKKMFLCNSLKRLYREIINF